MQLTHATPVAWKDCLAHGKGNSFNLAIQDQNLILKKKKTISNPSKENNKQSFKTKSSEGLLIVSAKISQP